MGLKERREGALSAVEGERLPEQSRRGSQYKARKAQCYKKTPYGPLLDQLYVPLHAGGELKTAVAKPLAMFHGQCAASPSLGKIAHEALARNPCSPSRPWNIVFYEDGVGVTDGLATHHNRNNAVFYSNLLEFGQRALAHEEVWRTLAIVREHVARMLVGGLAELANTMMGGFFKESHYKGPH